jgi:hypothetical protein
MSYYAIELNEEAISPDEIAGEDGITITESLNEARQGGNPLKAVSGTFVFYGRAWQIINEQLIQPTDGKRKYVRLRIFEKCTTPPELVFDGVIQGNAVDWCHGDCHCSATAVQETEDTRKADCFSSTLVSDNWNGFQEAQHPKFVYCDELRPEWLHITLLYLGFLVRLIYFALYPVVLIVQAIVSVLNTVIDVVNTLPGVNIARIDFDGDSTTNVMEEWRNINDRVLLAIIGCGRRHPSPLVRTYIENACGKCGLAFESSILNSPASEYFNLAYLFAPARKGIAQGDLVPTIYENRVLKTGDVFMDDLGVVFNGLWRVEKVGSVPTLRFERRDRLVGSSPWVDPVQLREAGRLVGEVCYEWDSDDLPAFGQFEYQTDPLDATSNEAKDRYNAIAEWNSPVSVVQRGKKEVLLPFGMARFRNDGVTDDLLSGFAGFYPVINDYNAAMLMTQGVVNLPKLVIWDGANVQQATAARYAVPGYGYAVPNWPMLFDTAGALGTDPIAPDAPGLGLYGRFHQIANPRVDATRGIRWKFTFEYTAAELVSRSLFKYVPLDYGRGRITEITINASKRQITVSGTV